MCAKTLQSVIVFSVVSVLSLPTIVFSQQGALEEITVTARKREESLNDVPVTVAAFTGSKMSEYNLVELEDMAQFIPAFEIASNSTTGGANINIRGVATNGTNSGFEQAVGMFTDGTYVGRSVWLNSGQLDLARMEVLKGPQGVYFGKNTVAGALNLISNDPTDEYEAYIQGSYEFEAANEAAIEGVVSGPLSDTFKARAAIRWNDSDGYGTNIVTGEDVVSNDEILGRVTLLWEPSDNLTVNTKINYADYEQLGSTFQPADCTSAPLLVGQMNALGGVENCVPDTNVTHVLLSAQHAGFLGRPEAATTTPLDEYDGISVGNTITWDIGDYTITNVTSYRDHDSFLRNDVDQWNSSGFFIQRQEDYSFWSNEIRISSPQDQKISWVAGVYYQDEELDFFTNPVVIIGIDGPPFGPRFNTGTPNLPFNGIPNEGPFDLFGGQFHMDNMQETKEISVFAEAAFDVTDQIQVTVGGRYADINKDGSHEVCVGLPFAITCGTRADDRIGFIASAQSYSGNADASDFSPSVTLRWTPNDDQMFYASYSEGFKAGGFDLELRSASAQAVSDTGALPASFVYQPETVEAWEAGTRLTLLDGRLQFNASAFRSEYEDLQVSTFDGVISFVISNAGASTAQGIELDTTWQVNDNLTLGAAVTFLDSTFDTFNGPCAAGVAANVDTDNDGTLDSCDHSGNDTPNAPNITSNIFARYTQAVGDNMILSLTGDASFRDETIASDNDPASISDAFWRLNASIGISDSSDRWRLALIGRNLLDEQSWPGFGNLPNFTGVGNPKSVIIPIGRQLTVQARYSFF